MTQDAAQQGNTLQKHSGVLGWLFRDRGCGGQILHSGEAILEVPRLARLVTLGLFKTIIFRGRWAAFFLLKGGDQHQDKHHIQLSPYRTVGVHLYSIMTTVLKYRCPHRVLYSDDSPQLQGKQK